MYLYFIPMNLVTNTLGNISNRNAFTWLKAFLVQNTQSERTMMTGGQSLGAM
jgi:hypothetical protein